MNVELNIKYMFEIVKRDDSRRLVSLLHQCPEAINHKDSDGNTMLFKAAFYGRPMIIRILLDNGADVKCINVHGLNALCLATYNGSIDCVRLLLNYWTYEEYSAMSTVPPLCVAAMCGHMELVRFFCKLGDPGKFKTIHGMNPLMLAAIYGQKEVALFFRNFPSLKNCYNALGQDYYQIVEGLKRNNLCK